MSEPTSAATRAVSEPTSPARDATIEDAVSAEQIGAVRALFEEYQASLDVDLCFQGFAEELAGLPGAYARPSGRLWLVTVGGEPRGCVALRRLDDSTCEMKRLYVRPGERARGLGKALVERLIAEARAIGYRRMVLDTLPTMTRALALYQSLGFVEIPPYRFNPVAGTRYLCLAL